MKPLHSPPCMHAVPHAVPQAQLASALERAIALVHQMDEAEAQQQ